MAPRISTLYCLVLIGLLTRFGGGVSQVGLSFSGLSPAEVFLQRNHPLLLNCSGSSDEGPLHVFWKYQDSLIRDKHFQIFSNGSLFAEKTSVTKKKERRWEGNYTCLLKNRLGSLLSRPIRVIFARMAKAFTHEPQPLTVTEGGQARFSCQIYAVPQPVYTWYKDGMPLPQNNSRYIFLSSGTLQIHGVTSDDAGDYKCHCANIARQKNSTEATLTVLPRSEEFQPPSFLSPGGEVTALAGHPATLECLADGFPDVELTWTREGEFADGEEVFDLLDQEGNLHFPEVQAVHSGSYICTATILKKDTNQMATAIQRLLLTVHVPPTFTKNPANQVVPTSQTVRFECEAAGTPAPSLRWLKDGEPVYINGRIKLKSGNTLVVSQTVTSDSGIYQCMAENSAGAGSVAARLQVNASSDQPQPPTNLRAFTMGSNAIMLAWDPVVTVPSAPIQAYTVHYVPSNGGLEQDAVSVNTSLLVERLKPYTNYTFYVRAYSNKSATEPSQPTVQLTGEDVPLSAPKVTLSAISPTTLQVQWDELPVNKARGIITGHRIYYRKHKQASATVRTINNAATEYTITGLTPKQKYDVRVLSSTKAGFPTLSDDAFPWVTYEMPSPSSSKVPSSPIIHLTVLNSTAIEVEWSLPPDNQYPVQGYYLSYRQQNKPLSPRVTLPAGETKFLMQDLVPQTWYEVHLIAYNKKGESQESVRKITTSSGDNIDADRVEVVEPPLHLEAEPTSSSVIRLTWKSPQTTRNISHYTVRYHRVVARGLVNESYIQSTNNEVIITDLQPFTLYEFAVRSHDVNKNQGPFSPTVECRTKESLPSSPQDLTWAPLDATSIRLNWQPPNSPNGVIIAYKILWNTRNNQNLESWNSKEEKGTESTTVLSGLSSNTLYYLRMAAKNSAGFSPNTESLHINIPVRNHNNTAKLPSQETPSTKSRNYAGIIIGVAIGLSCFILCVVIFKCRHRCCRSRPADPSAAEGGARYAPCRGNGFLPQRNGHARDKHIEVTEMECITPMLPAPQNGGEGNKRHLDTKGGNGMCNGRVNGAPLQMLRNSQTSSGSQEGAAPDPPVPQKNKRYTSTDRDPLSEGDVTTSTVLLDDSLDTKGANNSSSCENPPPVPPHQHKTVPSTNSSSSCLQSAASRNPHHGTQPCNRPEARPHKGHQPADNRLPPDGNQSESCSSDSQPASSHNGGQPVSSVSGSLPGSSVSSIQPVSSHNGSQPVNGSQPASSHNGRQPELPYNGSQPVSPIDGIQPHHANQPGQRDSDEPSRPFSVNAFMSPLAGPRFVQSTNENAVPEPT